MAIETINIGAVANDGTGDPLRTAFDKINNNDSDLDTRVDAAQSAAEGAQSAAEGAQADADASVKSVNGVEPATDGSLTIVAGDIGDAVLSVNGSTPDTSGNVTIEAGGISSINGIEPSTDGSVTLIASDIRDSVLTVNGVEPSTDGNVSLGADDIPGAVLSVNGNSPATDGDVSVDVEWGKIGGTLASQTDLQSALNAKSNRNYIINGGFQINQRGVSGTVTLSAGAYGHDRWKAGASGCTYTFATSGGVTTITISAGSLQQVIEGANLETDTYTLSWGGTAQGKIGGAGSYGASGISASVTGGSNLTIEFNTGTLSKVQLERGSQATDFENRHYAHEEVLCLRYGEKNTLFIQPGFITASVGGTLPYRVAKRVKPTVTLTPSYVNSNTFQVLAASDQLKIAWNIATTSSGGFATVDIFSSAEL